MAAFSTVLADFRHRSDAQAARNDSRAHGVAWIEGEIVPINEARIPIVDQGFLHSDLTYDVVGVWDGRFFRLEDHLDRLEAGCAKMRLRSPLSKPDLRKTLIDLVATSGLTDAYVEIIVTRGASFVREAANHQAPHAIYCLALPYVWIQPLEQQDRGSSAIVTRTVRRTPPGAMDPTVKNLQWGDFTRGLLEASDRGSILPILPDGDGNITEGSGFNVFVVNDKVLHTPRRGVLEGVTRRTVLDIAQAKGWTVKVEETPVDLLYACDELFFTSTAGGIIPVTNLDGAPIKDGKVGSITREVWEAYWELHSDPSLTTAVDYSKAAQAT